MGDNLTPSHISSEVGVDEPMPSVHMAKNTLIAAMMTDPVAAPTHICRSLAGDSILTLQPERENVESWKLLRGYEEGGRSTVPSL